MVDMSVKMACLRILNQTNSREDNLICITLHILTSIRESFTQMNRLASNLVYQPLLPIPKTAPNLNCSAVCEPHN